MLNGAVRQTATDRGLVQQPGERHVRVKRLAAAAQNHRVARFQADSGRIDRHIRARLVDDADHTERNTDLFDEQPVRAGRAGKHPADRIGLRRDHPESFSHLRNAPVGQRKPIDHRRGEPRGFRRFQILLIGRLDRRNRRLNRLGHAPQTAILLLGREHGKCAGRNNRFLPHLPQDLRHHSGIDRIAHLNTLPGIRPVYPQIMY